VALAVQRADHVGFQRGIEAADAGVQAVQRFISVGFATGEGFESVGNSLGLGTKPGPEALGSGVEGRGGRRAPSEHR
jgi:hypothetical protein